MTFSRVNALGWTDDFSTITAAQINGLDVNLTSALDGLNGGYYTPTAELAIGGQGLHIWDSVLLIGDGSGQNGIFTIESGSLGGVASGGTWTAASGSTTNLAGTTSLTGHGHTVASGGWFNVASGGYIKIAAGGEVDNAGAFVASTGSSNTFQAGSTVAIAGTLNIGATCVATQTNGATLDLYGDVTLKNTGTFTTAGSSTFALNGAMTVGATGAIATTSTGSITVATGGSLAVNSGATATVNGTLAGSITRTAAVTRSGNTANEYLRVTSGTDADGTYNPTFDVLFVNISVDRTYTINDGTEGQVVRLAVNGVLSTAELTVADSGNNTLCILAESVLNVNAKKGVHVDLIWHSGAWRVIGGYGLYA